MTNLKEQFDLLFRQLGFITLGDIKQVHHVFV